MNYADARPGICSGDLLAWGHDAWRSWHDLEVQAVRFFTRSEYAHVAVAWVIGKRVLVIEAVVPQVRIFPLSKLLPCYWISGEPRLSWTETIESKALELVGQPYSKREAIRTFFGKVVPGANDQWQCAEVAACIRGQLLTTEYMSPTPTTLVKETQRLPNARMRYIEP